MTKEWKCPYTSWCGENGMLCDRCKEDRADERAKEIADAIRRLGEDDE